MVFPLHMCMIYRHLLISVFCGMCVIADTCWFVIFSYVSAPMIMRSLFAMVLNI